VVVCTSCASPICPYFIYIINLAVIKNKKYNNLQLIIGKIKRKKRNKENKNPHISMSSIVQE
jgi:hypothetical protein